MNLFKSSSSDDNKPKLSQILGGVIGGFEEAFSEMEAPSIANISKGVSEVVREAVSSTISDVAGTESKSTPGSSAMPDRGSFNFDNKQAKAAETKVEEQKKAAHIKNFNQSLDQDLTRAKYSRDRMIMEAEIRHEVSNMPKALKNETLGFQADYEHSDSIYHMAELRRKLKEQQKQQERQQKATSMAQTGGKASAMNAALEGGSGSQGGGQANLSFQAAG